MISLDYVTDIHPDSYDVMDLSDGSEHIQERATRVRWASYVRDNDDEPHFYTTYFGPEGHNTTKYGLIEPPTWYTDAVAEFLSDLGYEVAE